MVDLCHELKKIKEKKQAVSFFWVCKNIEQTTQQVMKELPLY